VVISLHLTLQGCCVEEEIVCADRAECKCTQQGVPHWEKQNGLKASHSGKSSFYTHAPVKRGRCEGGEEDGEVQWERRRAKFHVMSQTGPWKGPSGGTAWAFFFLSFFFPLIASPVSCPVLLRLDIQYICVCTWPPHEVSCCQYFESRSWALRSVLIQAQTVAPGQNASPCSAPYSAAVYQPFP